MAARHSSQRPVVEPSMVGEGDAGLGLGGGGHRDQAAGRGGQGEGEEQGRAAGQAAAEHQQAGGGRPDQQGEAPVVGPAAGNGHRGQLRPGPDLGHRLGRGQPGGAGRAHPEPEDAVGAVPVDRRDDPPADRVAAGREPGRRDPQLEGPAGDRSGGAAGDDPSAAVEDPDRGQPRVGSLGEAEGHRRRRPLQRVPAGWLAGLERAVGGRRRTGGQEPGPGQDSECGRRPRRCIGVP